MASQETIVRDALREINQQTATNTDPIHQDMVNVLPDLHNELVASYPWVFSRKAIVPVRKVITLEDGTQRDEPSIYGRNYRAYQKPNDYLGYPELHIRDLGIGSDDQERFILREDLHVRIWFSDDLFVFEYNAQNDYTKAPAYYSRYLSVALAERASGFQNPGQRQALVALLDRRRTEAEGADRSQRDINHLSLGGPSDILRAAGGVAEDPRARFGIWPRGPFAE